MSAAHAGARRRQALTDCRRRKPVLRHGADNLAVRGGIVARSSIGSSITEIVFCATVQAIVAVPPEQTVVTGLAE
jgi:hypothetical protein